MANQAKLQKERGMKSFQEFLLFSTEVTIV